MKAKHKRLSQRRIRILGTAVGQFWCSTRGESGASAHSDTSGHCDTSAHSVRTVRVHQHIRSASRKPLGAPLRLDLLERRQLHRPCASIPHTMRGSRH